MCPGCRKQAQSGAVLNTVDHRYWHRGCLEHSVSLQAQDAIGSERFDSPTDADLAAFDAEYARRAAAVGLS